MPAELWPAVLGQTRPQLVTRWQRARHLSTSIHLDILDGVFLRGPVTPITALAAVSRTPSAEIHAMVSTTELLEQAIRIVRPQRVYIHVELGRQRAALEGLLKKHRIEIGYAISPDTRVSRLAPCMRPRSSVLVMSVHPGRYGARFWPGAITRITAIRSAWPKSRIIVDGGMNSRTIAACITAGCSGVVVGSDLMLRRNPGQEWRHLTRLTKYA